MKNRPANVTTDIFCKFEFIYHKKIELRKMFFFHNSSYMGEIYRYILVKYK